MTFSTNPVAGVNSFYVNNAGTWQLLDHYDRFKVTKRQNQMSAFEIQIFDIQTAEKAYFKEQAEVLFFAGTKLILKGRIQQIQYVSAFETVARGFGMEAILLDKDLIKDGDKRVDYTNISAQTIANELISQDTNGTSPFLIPSNKKGLYNQDYGTITMRFEHGNKLNALAKLADSLNYDWWVSQHPDDDYDADYINISGTRGVSEESDVVGGSSFSQALYSGSNTRYSQKRIVNAEVTKLAFKLGKTGSPTGDVTFVIRKTSDDSAISSKIYGDASLLGATPAWEEVTFDATVSVDEEVYLSVEYSSGDVSNSVLVEYDTDMDIPNEVRSVYNGSWADGTTQDLAYRLNFDVKKTFNITTNTTLTSQEKDVTNLVNKVTILGYGDGNNQLKTTAANNSATFDLLASSISSTATTISLVDASSFAASGHVRIAEESVKYTGKSTNDLTGCTRGQTSTVAKTHKGGVYVEQGPDKYEFYDAGTLTAISVFAVNWKAQTFTVGNVGTNENIDIRKLRLLLRKQGNPTGSIQISIRAVDGSFHPTGEDLSFGSAKASELIADSGSLFQHVFEMSPTQLNASTQYAIVIRLPDGDSANFMDVGYVNTIGTYGGGERLFSSDSGAVWTIATGDDVRFEIWGNTADSEDGSSIGTYGTLDKTEIDRTLMDVDTAELVASKILTEKKDPIERIKLVPDEPMADAGLVQIGDQIAITDTESDISGNFRVVGVEYISNYGHLEMSIEASNRSLAFMEQLRKEREVQDNLAKYMQGSTNIFTVQETENAESGAPIDVFFNIPDDAVSINKITLSYRNMKPRTYADTAASGGGSTPTTTSGGSQTPTSSSGGSSTPTSDSVTSDTSTSNFEANPGTVKSVGTTWTDLFSTHSASANPSTTNMPPYALVWLSFEGVQTALLDIRLRSQDVSSTSATIGGARYFASSAGVTYNKNTGNQGDFYTVVTPDRGNSHVRFTWQAQWATGSASNVILRGYGYEFFGEHSHDITIAAHDHTVTILAHDHTVTIAAHTHLITYNINEQAYTTTDVGLSYTNDASGTPVWTDMTGDVEQAEGTLGFADEAVENDIDITRFYSGTGWKGVRVTPNGNSRHKVQVNIKCFIESQ